MFLLNLNFNKLKRKSKRQSTSINSNVHEIYKDVFSGPTKIQLYRFFELPVIRMLWTKYYLKKADYQEWKQYLVLHTNLQSKV